MIKEEWNKLTELEFSFLTEDDVLKHLIKFTEERYISYKKLIEDLHKDKISYEADDWRVELLVWFKDHLRERKNKEESDLKSLRTEIEFHRQGMNPPYCYPKFLK